LELCHWIALGEHRSIEYIQLTRKTGLDEGASSELPVVLASNPCSTDFKIACRLTWDQTAAFKWQKAMLNG